MDPYRDAVVSAIRVAEALNERLAVLFRWTRLGSDTAGLVLGEADQIYKEIWSQLDVARAELAKRGHDVGAYDRLRASDALRRPAVLDVHVEHSSWSDALFYDDDREKIVEFNVEGHAAAATACRLLRAALPGVDWEALDQTAAVEQATTPALRRPVWPLAVAVIGIALPIAWLASRVA